MAESEAPTGDRSQGGESKRTAPPTPTGWELDMAFTWVLLNTIRLFHKVPIEDVTEAEDRFSQRWRAIPAERRQAALDYNVAREERIRKMRALV